MTEDNTLFATPTLAGRLRWFAAGPAKSGGFLDTWRLDRHKNGA
jgi:hypothetical protein